MIPTKSTIFAGLIFSVLLSQPAYGTDTVVPFIHADAVHAQVILGQGVTVVVIDDGILPHTGLDGSIAEGGTSFEDEQQIDDGGASATPWNEHGTFVSLEITDSSGVAPAAMILPIRVFDAMGNSSWDDLREAIKYARLRRKADPTIRVINMSLGGGWYTCTCDNDDWFIPDLQNAIAAAEIEGILSFAASGNEAQCGYICAPACTTSAIPVAASYDDYYDPEDFGDCMDIAPQPYWIVCFSNIDYCDFFLAAPGFDINVGGYTGWSGTSMATPVVSGVAALMWSKLGCGSLSAPEARNIIFSTADSYSWGYPYCYIWQPDHVNALSAVNAVPAGTAPGTGDLDCDGTVSGDDFHALEHCMTGPNQGPVVSFCVAGDFSESPPDGDVDLRDFAAFQRAFTGYGEGACCHGDGTCTQETVADCRQEFLAQYQGHGTTCAGVTCPLPPWGACCDLYTGACTVSAEDDCVWSGGVYQGDGTSCATVSCPVVRYDNTIDPLTVYVTASTGKLADDATLSGSGGGWLRQYTVGVFGGYAGPFSVTVALYNGYPPEGSRLIAGTQRTFNVPDSPSPAFLSPLFDPPIWIPHSVWIRADFSNSAAGWFRAEQAEVGFTENYYARYDPPWNKYWWGGSPYAGLWATIACVPGKDGPGDDEGGIPESPQSPETPERPEILVAPPAQDLRAPIHRGSGSPRGGDGPRLGTVALNLESPSAGLTVQPGEVVQWSVTATVSQGDNAGLALVTADLVQDAANPEQFDIPPATIVGTGMEGFDRPNGIANPGPGGAGSAYGGTPIGPAGAMSVVQIGGAQNTFGEPGGSIGLDFAVDTAVGQSGPQVIAAGTFTAPTTPGVYVFRLENGLANVLQSMQPPPSPPDFWPVSAASVALGSPSITFTVGEVTCTLGDVNDDDIVDGRDIQPFVTVFLNPAGASPQQLCATDMTEDDLLDDADVAAFVASLLAVSTPCTRGDVNGDAAIDGQDIEPFVAVLLDPGSASPQQRCAADVNEDETLGYDDVISFVARLLAG